MRKKRKRKNNFLNLMLIMIALILIIVSAYQFYNKPLETRFFEIKFIVGSNPGIGIFPEELHFGKLTPGGAAIKTITLKNDYKFPIKMQILLSDNLQNLISFNDISPSIMPGESILLPVTLSIPRNMSYGNYTGRMMLEFKKI